MILLSVTVFVCHDKGNVFCSINSPVYVYWKQEQHVMCFRIFVQQWDCCFVHNCSILAN